jgi:hypothetical protein
MRERDTMTINIRQFVSDYCIHKDQGNKLYTILKARIDQGILVKLNFYGVRLITSSFLYASIGKLFKDFTNTKI